MNSIMINKSNLPCIKVLKTIFTIIVILLSWELVALLINDNFFMPNVAQTLKSLASIITSDTFFKIIFTAFYRVFLGLIVGIFAGVLFATLCNKFEIINMILSPIISIMKATPVACIIVLLWIRLNYTGIAIFVVVLMVLPIVWQNVYDGYKAIDKNLIEVTQVFELNRIQKLKVLVVPSILSYLLPAIITSVGLAWKAEVAAEIMTNNNMGQLIYDYKTVSYDTASIFAWTVIIVLFSIILEKITKYFIGRLANDLKD